MTTLEIWSIDRRTPLGVRGADGEAGEGYEGAASIQSRALVQEGHRGMREDK